MHNLTVSIVRYVDDREPGWVACEFEDASGRRHTFIDKVPIFTSEKLRLDSGYPRPGKMPCEIIGRWRDADGRELARISTANPLDNKSADGLSEFAVLFSHLSEST
jgi:hypothetical protein